MRSNTSRKFISPSTNASQCSDLTVSSRWWLMVASSSGRTLPTLAKDTHSSHTTNSNSLEANTLQLHIKGGPYEIIYGTFREFPLIFVRALTTRWSAVVVCTRRSIERVASPHSDNSKHQFRMGRSIEAHRRLFSPREMSMLAWVHGRP